MSSLTWAERVPMLSVNPDAATREDVARLTAELMDARFILAHAAEGDDVLIESAVFMRPNFPARTSVVETKTP